MKIYILTDQEGAAGVVNAPDYAAPGDRHHEIARELVMGEVNAAIEGAIAAGGDEFFVLDGHGHGSLDVCLIHPAARVLTGRPLSFPFGLDGSFDAMFLIGHHAKANTRQAHLAHTFSFGQFDFRVNDVSLGEIGYYMLLASELGVPAVLVTGDEAACAEARTLSPNIEIAAVKQGWNDVDTAECTAAEARLANGAAIHRAPEAARQMIREAATRAVGRREEIDRFWLEPPYELVSTLRPEKRGDPKRIAVNRAQTVLELGQMPRDHVINDPMDAG